MTLRIGVWGPGHVGRAVIRALQEDPRFDLEIVKARRDKQRSFSDVAITTSKDEVISLGLDCVVVTPSAAAVFKGLDDDVIDLLESGTNVVATAAYHNPWMQNWASGGRASARRLLEACKAGAATLHGTGVHPSYMVERLVLTMCQPLDSVSHIRFVEAANFQGAPGDMWGGLGAMGFGVDIDEIGPQHPVAAGGDLYYGDVIGNETIRRGTAGAVHLVHRGYLGDHHFFTNEECWYLRDAVTFRGDDLPFGGFTTSASYTIEITGEPANLRSQLEFQPTLKGRDAITNGSVRAVLAAIPAVCAAEPGILVDDSAPSYRLISADD
ncbi:MAG: hypothetical protein KDB20_15025 [Microthrixaceae bacterium]|nr:hypothetical protein [Microthrixaceae bacterium]